MPIIIQSLGAHQMFGAIFFDQHLTRLNLIGMTIIIAGVVIMNLGGVSH
jgi:small multidrug resistance pump